jgi:ParB-like chromosome segregation protein Spo0J
MSLIPPVQQNLAIVYQSTNTLKPRSTNPRTHSKKQISQIAIAIGRFGFTNPILVDDTNGIIAGHGRLEAAKTTGLRCVCPQ